MPTAYPVNEWTDASLKTRLLDLLRRLSYVEGEVVLASGKVSNFYIDCRQTSLHPEGAWLIGKIFDSWFARLPYTPGAVGGMTMGADPLVTATSVISYENGRPVTAFLIRKEPKGHGLKKWIEGRGDIANGAKVVLLEDVVTTGGSTVKAINACRDEGLEVADVFCLVDRQEGGAEAIGALGVKLTPIFTRKDFKPEG
jgi:orotate phosphoribosyltransferase